ncbi:MAG: alpha/beta hydrolase [Bdellovibrionales bacterium]|nr:alpha/beta hydrolase [Bdellovibrionales bacterium]
MKPIVSVCFIIFSFLMMGCSSVFYQPDQNLYIDPEKLPIQPEPLNIKASDGHEIPAWHFKTSMKVPKGVFIHFHGNAQNLSSHFAFLASAPVHGYDHVIFDYRGYGRSEGRPTPKNTVSDGKDVLLWARKEFPGLPIIVFGQSLGGAVALKSLIDLGEQFTADAVVIDSSFASYRSEARTVLANHWLTWLLQPIGWLVVDNSMAPGQDVSKIKTKAFIVAHGDKDTIVDISHGRKIFKYASDPKEFWLVEKGHHTEFMFRKDQREALYDYLGKVLQ